MDYEQYYSDAQTYFKVLKEKTTAQSKNITKIRNSLSDGDINALPKLFAILRGAAQEREEALCQLEELTANFDCKEYMSSGDFSEQMIECCNQMGVDVKGTFPSYEMFPWSVTIYPEAQEIAVDRKRMPCLRPSKLVGKVKAELDKLNNVTFNTSLFAKELSVAYDLAIIKTSKKKHCADNAPMYAIDLYEFLTPMKRYKKEYTKQSYAYDLARLYAEGIITMDDGRELRFDTARNTKKAIRILDRFGSEQFITTVRFS